MGTSMSSTLRTKLCLCRILVVPSDSALGVGTLLCAFGADALEAARFVDAIELCQIREGWDEAVLAETGRDVGRRRRHRG